MNRMNILGIACAAALGFWAAGPALATTHTWTNTAGGAQSWQVGANWSGGAWPSPVSGDTVDFSTVAIATNTTLTLQANRTAEVWKFGDTGNARDWTIAASNKIILAGTTPTINVVNRTATLLNALDGSAGLTKTGAGTLTIGSTNNTYTGATLVSNGTLKLLPGASGGIVPLANIAATAQDNTYSNISNTVAWIGMDRGTQASPDKNALAGNDYTKQWTPGAVNSWGKWDLDKTATNASFNIANVFWWQYSQDGYGTRGISTAKLYYSNMTADPGAPGDGNSNWTRFFDNTGGTAFPLSGGVNNHHTVVELPNLSFAARWIGILPTTPSPQDGNGLASILFTTAPAPGGSLPSSTALSIASGATFDLNGNFPGQTIASLSDSGGGGGTVTNSATNKSTLTINPSSGSTTFSGAIGGPISLVKSGIATQVLAGASTHTGGTTVSNGTLLVNGSITGAVSVASGGTLGGTGAITGNVTFATGASALFTHGAQLTFTGPVTLNNNTVHLTLPANLADGNYLLATGSFSGMFAVTPVIDSGSTASPNRMIATSPGQVRLIVSATDIFPPTPDPMTFAVNPRALNSSSVVMTATTATEGFNPPVQYYFENITNGNNSGWTTATVWTNTGLTAATTYVYRVKARDSATPPNETAWSNQADIVTLGWPAATNLYWDGGTTNIAGNGNGASLGGSGTWNTALRNWDLGSTYPHVAWDGPNNDTAVFGGTAGTVTLGTVAAGSMKFTNFTGTYTLTGGSLAINSNLTVDATAGNVTLSTPVSGSGGMVKNGANTLTLNGANTYGGGTTVNTGILSLGGTANDLLGTGLVTVNSGATLNLNGNGNLTTSFAFNSATVTNGNSFSANLNGPVALTNTTSIELFTTGNMTIGGIVSGGGGLTKKGTGAGPLTLTGANTFAGPVSIHAGTLSVASLNRVSGGTATSNLGAPTNATNGTISLGSTTTAATLGYSGPGETTDRVIKLAGTTGGATLSQAGTPSGITTTRGTSGLLKFTSNVSVPGSGTGDNRKTLTLTHVESSNTGTHPGSGEISGSIGDSLTGTTGQRATSLTKAGLGTWTLSGSNTYSGATKVQAGTLALTRSDALGTGLLDITNGAKVQLDYIGTRQISTLTFNAGTAKPNGTYGSSSSPATNKDDTRFAGPGTVTVGPIANATITTLALTNGTNPSNGGAALTFTATVTGPSPTGSVMFYDGLTLIGTGTLNGSNQASVTTSTLAQARTPSPPSTWVPPETLPAPPPHSPRR